MCEQASSPPSSPQTYGGGPIIVKDGDGRVIGKDNSQSTITVRFDENGVDETYRLPADLNRGRGRLRLTLPEEEKPHVVYKNGVHRSGVE